jgi:hypothetical protein
MEYWIARSLDAMSNNDLPVAQQNVRQKIDKNSKQRTFARAFCPRNEINTVIQQIGKR